MYSITMNQIAAVGDQLVERDEVRMRNVAERAELLLEAVDRGRVGLPHRLDRHGHSPLPIPGAVDDPHTPFAEDVDDLVPIELRPGRFEHENG